MANGNRLSGAAEPALATDRKGRSLRVDPSLPRALVEAVVAGSTPGEALGPSNSAAVPERPQLPRRLPAAIAAEMPPNLLYRRYPLVTSLLVELDELRPAGWPVRRGR